MAYMFSCIASVLLMQLSLISSDLDVNLRVLDSEKCNIRDSWELVDIGTVAVNPISNHYEVLHASAASCASFKVDLKPGQLKLTVYVKDISGTSRIEVIVIENDKSKISYVYNRSNEDFKEEWHNITLPIDSKYNADILLLGFSQEKDIVLVDAIQFIENMQNVPKSDMEIILIDVPSTSIIQPDNVEETTLSIEESRNYLNQKLDPNENPTTLQKDAEKIGSTTTENINSLSNEETVIDSDEIRQIIYYDNDENSVYQRELQKTLIIDIASEENKIIEKDDTLNSNSTQVTNLKTDNKVKRNTITADIKQISSDDVINAENVKENTKENKETERGETNINLDGIKEFDTSDSEIKSEINKENTTAAQVAESKLELSEDSFWNILTIVLVSVGAATVVGIVIVGAYWLGKHRANNTKSVPEMDLSDIEAPRFIPRVANVKPMYERFGSDYTNSSFNRD